MSEQVRREIQRLREAGKRYDVFRATSGGWLRIFIGRDRETARECAKTLLALDFAVWIRESSTVGWIER